MTDTDNIDAARAEAWTAYLNRLPGGLDEHAAFAAGWEAARRREPTMSTDRDCAEAPMTGAERARDLVQAIARAIPGQWGHHEALVLEMIADIRSEQAERIAGLERERDDYIEAMRELAERAAAAMAAAEARLAQAQERVMELERERDTYMWTAEAWEVSSNEMRHCAEAAEADLAQARADALEEAARVAEAKYADPNWHPHYHTAAMVIAEAIRALAGDTGTGGDGNG